MAQTHLVSSTEVEDAIFVNTFMYRVVKRVLDFCAALVMLAAFIPLLFLIGATVRISSSGPVFYEWKVVGRGGRVFTGYKFRTMVWNADELKGQLWEYNERGGPTFKMRNDPRVTTIGRFLRKFSLDELPQLWSVLKGDMGIVGPRPVGLEEWALFEPYQRRKLSVMPGGICLWHVRGKPRVFEEWIMLDLEYIDTWSIWLEMKIVGEGLWYILLGKNY